MTQSSPIDLGSLAFKANPYPTFARLRTSDPIHQMRLPDGQTAWLITRYADAEPVLRDERFVKNLTNAFDPDVLATMPWASWRLTHFTYRQMVCLDTPDHTRLRALISLAFTPRRIEGWRERIQHITDELMMRCKLGARWISLTSLLFLCRSE